MPKRGSDANNRIFFDELVSIAASRLRATGAIRLEDRHGIIAFGDKQKLVGVAHTKFPTAARGATSFAQNVAEGQRSSGSSTTRHAAGSASKSSACAIARLTASAGLSV